MSDDILSKFNLLVRGAVAEDPIVVDAITSVRSKYRKEPQNMSERELKKYISSVGTEIIKKHQEQKPSITFEDLPQSVQELLSFASEMSPSEGDDITQCKDPLKGLDITFDQIAGQEEAKEQIEKQYIFPIRYPSLFKTRSNGILFYGPPGTGKCTSPDEKIIMFDGSVKKAKYIQVNDLLMGDDSTPRKVLTTCSGKDEMYQIIPTKGEPFIVNGPHLITLVCSTSPRIKTNKKEGRYRVVWAEQGKILSKSFTGLTSEKLDQAQKLCKELRKKSKDVIDIPLEEYMKKSSSWKKFYKGFRIGVEWDEKEVPFDPWFVGLWLGDGSSHYPQITNIDDEILIKAKDIIEKNGLQFNRLKVKITYSVTRGSSERNIFLDTLKNLNLIKNKHIPDIYKINSRNVRLKLLAGLLDSDGHLTCNCYEIIQKSKRLAKDIVFLARSLGYYVSIKKVQKTCTNSKNGRVTGDYYRCFISGENLEEIPVALHRKKAIKRKQIKNASNFGFSVKSLGRGKYCGFTLDGNGRFLLKDFTVTHNSLLAKASTSMLPDVAFYAPSPAELKGKYEGETEKRISEVFQCAADMAEDPDTPYTDSVIFIDEFDSLAGAGRENDPGMRRSVNTLLQAMDGIASSPLVSVIAATNYPWSIDDAVLRRFGSRIMIDLPDIDAREFIIRQALIRNYSNPLLKDKEVKKIDVFLDKDDEGRIVEWNDEALDNIRMWGVPHCRREEEVKGYFSTKKERKSTYIDANDIHRFAEEMGPTTEGKEIVQSIKDGKEVDPDEYADKSSLFGYSASDITKVMQIAVQSASLRALNGLFAPYKFNGEIWLIAINEPVSTVIIEGEEIEFKAKYALFDDIVDEYKQQGLKISKVPTELSKKILNFSMCTEDIDGAIKTYPSTIKNSGYIAVLNYRYQGKTPST
jgi:SpoVK/Ycf46/Vps4 family AAA+-type ATPase